MKQIFLKVYPNGKTSTNATVLNFDHEHNTGEIVIDFSEVSYLDWTKQLDLVFADGTHTFVEGTGNTLTVPLLESYLKKGSMTVQPLAKRLVGETYEKIKWQMVALSVRDSLNVLEDDTSITTSIAEQWEIRIDAVEQEELTRQSNEDTRIANENERISYLNLVEGIKNTTQFITFNTDGTVQKVEHKNDLDEILREDVFSYGSNLITEIRTLSTSEQITYIYHLDTLETEII